MDKDIDTLRQLVLEESGFDLYSSPRFVEGLVCQTCGLVQTDRLHSVDGVHPTEDFEVEIKLSALVTDKKFGSGRNTYTRSYFSFANLQGAGDAGKGADVFVLVGYTGERLRFFVLPACAVDSRKQIEIFTGPRIYKNTGKWLDYEVDYATLVEVVRRRGLMEINNTPLL